MGFVICIFYVALLQFACGQYATNTGTIPVNTGQTARGLAPITQQANNLANGPAGNAFAGNIAVNGNALRNNMNANLASASFANSNTGKADPRTILSNSNLASSNYYGSQNFVKNIATSTGQANLQAVNQANLGYPNPNVSNLVNSNPARSELANQLYPSNFAIPWTQTQTSPIPGNAGIVKSPNAGNSYYDNLNLANSYLGAVNPNAGGLSTNLVNSLPGNNYANANFASASAAGRLENGWDLNAGAFNLANGGNYLQVFDGSPGSQSFGLHISADALEVGGTVTVSGKMPIYGTVSLNGNLPTDGAATVNYGCASRPTV